MPGQASQKAAAELDEVRKQGERALAIADRKATNELSEMMSQLLQAQERAKETVQLVPRPYQMGSDRS